jgi:splicing factor 3B subunit 5
MATIQSQLEHLQAKYTGTGHPDITKHEWAVQQRRDAYASYIGHPSLMTYFGVALNEPRERVRCTFLRVK